MKRILFKTLALCIAIFLAFPAAAFADHVHGLEGAGTFEDPLKIYTPEDFEKMGNGIQMSKDHYFALMNDISITNQHRVGNFAGVLNGNGHTIFVNIGDGGNLAAPFTFTNNRSVIANIHVAGIITVSENDRANAGGLVGTNYGVVINCTSSVNITSAHKNVGGLVGINGKHGSIINCHADGDILGESSVGGLVGSNKGQIILGSASGKVSGNHHVGGLVGYNANEDDNLIQQSDASGSATFASGNPPTNHDGENIGGVVGGNAGTISNEAVDIYEVQKASIPDTMKLAFALDYPPEAAKAYDLSNAEKKERQAFEENLEAEIKASFSGGGRTTLSSHGQSRRTSAGQLNTTAANEQLYARDGGNNYSMEYNGSAFMSADEAFEDNTGFGDDSGFGDNDPFDNPWDMDEIDSNTGSGKDSGKDDPWRFLMGIFRVAEARYENLLTSFDVSLPGQSAEDRSLQAILEDFANGLITNEIVDTFELPVPDEVMAWDEAISENFEYTITNYLDKVANKITDETVKAAEAKAKKLLGDHFSNAVADFFNLLK
ncbi:MAG: hypothetical protein LBR83_03130 [Clostridiales bacterium]|jgi:hypothetical protein|nr:hypothetical protein [Clostridiales bacterium]